MSTESSFLKSLGLQFAYFSGLARLSEFRCGGTGAILRFERVRPARAGRFQPLRSHEITPEFLNKIIIGLRRWKFDLVSIDEVCDRSMRLASKNRFACLTFDGGYRDFMISAYPVLAKHGVPFAIYLPTSFPDGLGEPWWLALEQIIAHHNRIGLVIDGREQHFNIARQSEKYQLHRFLSSWMRSLKPSELSVAVKDLCTRYSADLADLSRDASMSWDDVAALAADPHATIGSATVNYPILANMKEAAAFREMTMGRAVAQSATGQDINHFAYPFGDSGSFGRQHARLASEAGFVSAVSAVPGLVEVAGQSNLHALPRIPWDGRQRSLRAVRVILSGMMMGADRPDRTDSAKDLAVTSS